MINIRKNEKIHGFGLSEYARRISVYNVDDGNSSHIDHLKIKINKKKTISSDRIVKDCNKKNEIMKNCLRYSN